MRRFWFVGAVLAVAGAAVFGVSLAAQAAGCYPNATNPQYCDSDIAVVQTAGSSTPGEGSSTYSMVCSPLTTSSVYVGWTSLVQPPQQPASGTVYASPYQSFSVGQSTAIASANGSGNTVLNLPGGGTRYFVVADNQHNLLSNVAGPCSPLIMAPPPTDGPTQLNVFTNGPTTLYLNWKDNSTSTATSTFELQRFQVTPGTPSNLAVLPAATSAALSWNNNPVNAAPFYTVIERSAAASGQFGQNDSTVVSSTVAGGAATSTDANVSPGSVYYYRVQNCSQIDVQSYYDQNVQGGPVARPASACSGWSNTTHLTFITVPVAPAAPTVTPTGPTQINLSWPAVSGATSYHVRRNPDLSGAPVFKDIYTSVTSSYTDNTVQSSTTYIYGIEACNSSGCSAWGPSASASTPSSSQQPQPSQTYPVTVSVSPVNVGNISINPGGNVVFSSATFNLAAGTAVTLTAGNVALSYVFSNWTGTVCNGSANSTCNFTLNGTIAVTANFTRSLGYSGGSDLTASISNGLSGIAIGVYRWFGGWLDNIGRAVGVPAASGQTINLDQYFATIATTTSPVYVDSNLQPATVYMYRVAYFRPDGTLSAWSNSAAGITLPSGSQPTTVPAPICTAYGFCDHNVTGYHSPDLSQASEFQCSVNADCRNVGRASQQTQEH